MAAKFYRDRKCSHANAENDGGHRHQGQKWFISLCSQSFHTKSHHVNHFIWPLSGSLCGGSMEFSLVARKKCPQNFFCFANLSLEGGEFFESVGVSDYLAPQLNITAISPPRTCIKSAYQAVEGRQSAIYSMSPLLFECSRRGEVNNKVCR